MEIEPFLLLQRYRRDRRRLLEFVISRGLAGDPSPRGSFDHSTVDLDTVSVDYVIECAQSGGVFDALEATRRYYEELEYPVMMNVSSGNSFFLVSKPELSGSPPRRAAPQIGAPIMSSHSYDRSQTIDLSDREIGKFKTEIIAEDLAAAFSPSQLLKDVTMLSLGLPSLKTGLSEDDTGELAYEVLLASVILSGNRVLILPFEKRKKEKKSRFTVGIKSKKDGSDSCELSEDGHPDLLDVIRGQMEISEAMGACIKHGLRYFRSHMEYDQADVPQIVLELLTSLCQSDFPNHRSYTMWLKRQANVLEELIASDDFVVDEHTVLSMLVSQLKNVEEWGNTGADRHNEILTCIKGFASRLSSSPPKFGVRNESYYWSHSYHFNIKLYEKLLGSIFDVLEDGQIIEEAEEILKVLQLTWPILGITQRMHDALYGWLFFQQFVLTGEYSLLKHAVSKVQKVLASKSDGESEESYMMSLICSIEVPSGYRSLKLVDAILLNIFAWCSNQLEDCHLHFRQEKIHTLEGIVALAMVSGSCFHDEYGGIKLQFIKSVARVQAPVKLVHIYIERSIQAAYQRVLNSLDALSKREQRHPLMVLANQLKLIAEEFTSFVPVLQRYCPEAGAVSSLLLHQFYGKHLNPFLKRVVDLSEGVRSVLVASDGLELYLLGTLNSVSAVGTKSSFISYLHPYQIRETCLPFILHWVNSQHDNIFEWTRRAIQIEDWEPLSSQQRQATSIIEVFRIIEEIVDQFFGLNLPMDIIHLRSLLIGIYRCLDAYVQHIVCQQVDKSTLYPIPPALTRYQESLSPFIKKRSAEDTVLDEKVASKLDNLTVAKLCVQLNTLHFIREQLDGLEDAIKQNWMTSQLVKRQTFREVTEDSSLSSDSIDELFTIFDDVRRSSIAASDAIFDFIGGRAIFWDLRDSFLHSLYRGSVGTARIEKLIPVLDAVLDDICGLIIDPIRDQVVLSIFQASMDGYVWVILDGGPSRAFSETDVIIMHDDLNILKDFFVADGEGLSLAEVEKASGLAQQLLDLYSMKAETIIEMLRNASEHISDQPNHRRQGGRSARDADTLLRILCHKKDDNASQFLKLHYQLPKSSDYGDAIQGEQTSMSPFIPDILKRNVPFNWTEKGQLSFNAVKKKFLETQTTR